VIVLVLGGTRSGKSRVAESMAARLAGLSGHVTYLATAAVSPGDDDHAARVAAHQARRPASWSTVECTEPAALAAALGAADGAVLLDSLGTWVASHPDLAPDPHALADALRRRTAPTVVVSEEVGLSLHAPTEVGRRFIDALGAVNEAVSAVADRAVLVVAGRAVELPPPGDLPC
jgi:adenosyl cobinamide kinase/adenosyl cobinamide phosphate guanylyltransferase